MPSLETDIHLRMLEKAAARDTKGRLYGLHWGDPDQRSELSFVKSHYLEYYLSPSTVVLEIGPGGGRWTRYMMKSKCIYAVDYHQELIDELRKNFDGENLITIKNNGTDFPGVPDGEIDLIFSFGVFVHLDIDLIDSYLANMKRLLKPTSNVIIQYSDKTKPRAQTNPSFSENTPAKMLSLIRRHGYAVQDENRWALRHSALVRFTLPDSQAD